MYGLDDENILDLDKEIVRHAFYTPEDPAKVYESELAYTWANKELETKLEAMLKAPPPVFALDGTGTKVHRTIRRMQEAQAAG